MALVLLAWRGRKAACVLGILAVLAVIGLLVVSQVPALAERLKDARLMTKVEATGNYSYVSDRTHGPGYLLLGDAFAFIPNRHDHTS